MSIEMKESYIGPKGYTIYKESISVKEQISIRNELTVKPFAPKTSMVQPKPFPIYRESGNKFYIPRMYGIDTFGEVEKYTISDGKKIDIGFKGDLRDFQKPIVEAYLKSAKEVGGGLLEVPCGKGKTVMALNIIARIKRKALVIVHKEFLLNQWIERIEEFLPDAKVGRIQGQIVDIENKDIVIGMLQSLSMKEYPKEVFEDFGLTIIDETHHIGAEVFSRALFKIVSRNMLGLSATMNRKDGLTKVFKMFIGDIVYSIEREKGDDVLVQSITYETTDDDFNEVVYNFKGQTHYSIMIKKLCEYNHRSEFILTVLTNMLKDSRNNQIMILAHNKCLLTYLHNAVKHRNLASVGYYIGGMKEKDLKETEGKKVVIATYAMAEEALDIKTLSTLIMATPRTDVTQAVGRILRVKHERPLVVDIVDSHEIFQRQWKKRRTFYTKNKYTIEQTTSGKYLAYFNGKKNTENKDSENKVAVTESIWDIAFKKGSKVREKRALKKIEKSDNPFIGNCVIKISTEDKNK